MNRRCRDHRDHNRDNVGGVSDRNRNRNRHDQMHDGNVGGEQDFCQRVRRCHEDGQVGGVENRHHRRNRCCWW
ncbi:hypothetical protein [Pseudoneobacillus sp. C159]